MLDLGVKPRHVQPLLRELLSSFPAVAILGARQVGKSTLAQILIRDAWKARYVTLDDPAVLAAVAHDPDGWLDSQGTVPLVLDEVQRAPDLLRAVKYAIDRERRPGRFLLTGSANFLTLARVSESLAGRVALVDLLPFSWREWIGQEPHSWLEKAFEADSAEELVPLFAEGNPPPIVELRDQVLWGGFPPVRLMRGTTARAKWLASYIVTYLDRDLREISSIHRVPDFHRLLIALASRSGQLLNLADLGRDLGMVEMTVRRYVGILETTFQLFRVEAYFTKIGKRLVKRPKVYFTDTGLACHLLGIHDWESLQRAGKAGAMVETWVAGELKKWMNAQQAEYQLYFFRLHAGPEVDFLLARGEEIIAIEVKTGQQIDRGVLSTLERLEELLGGRLRMSVVLHGGPYLGPLAKRVLALPLTRAFGPSLTEADSA